PCRATPSRPKGGGGESRIAGLVPGAEPSALRNVLGYILRSSCSQVREWAPGGKSRPVRLPADNLRLQNWTAATILGLQTAVRTATGVCCGRVAGPGLVRTATAAARVGGVGRRLARSTAERPAGARHREDAKSPTPARRCPQAGAASPVRRLCRATARRFHPVSRSARHRSVPAC